MDADTIVFNDASSAGEVDRERDARRICVQGVLEKSDHNIGEAGDGTGRLYAEGNSC